MFRVLSDEEADQVKRWRAPDIEPGRVLQADLSASNRKAQKLTDIRFQASNDEDTKTVIRDTLTRSRNGTNTDADAFVHESDSDSLTTVQTIPNPSADMLQRTYDEGYAAGLVAAELPDEQPASDAVKDLTDAVSMQRNQFDEAVELELVQLAAAVAKLILHRELEYDPGMMHELVKDALAQLPITSQAPVVHMNPLDAEVVRSLLTSTDTMAITDDPELLRGACQIHSGAMLMEAGIDQLVASVSSARLRNSGE